MSDSRYPQSEKLAEAHEDRIAITEFLEWCTTQGIVLAKPSPHGYTYEAIHGTHDSLIMQYLEVNETELEQERRAMLAAAREETQ